MSSDMVPEITTTKRRLMVYVKRGMNWLPHYLAKKAMKPAELARLLGIHRQTVAKQISKPELSKPWAQRIAPILGISATELLFGPNSLSVPVATIPVLGETAPGRWMETNLAATARFSPVPAAPGRYESANQFAYLVAGDSMNSARIFDGDYVICIPYFEGRKRITGGDNVVVERKRGPLTERSCRKIGIVATGYELRSDLSAGDHKDVIFVERVLREGVERIETVEIVGLVIGTFHPML